MVAVEVAVVSRVVVLAAAGVAVVSRVLLVVVLVVALAEVGARAE